MPTMAHHFPFLRRRIATFINQFSSLPPKPQPRISFLCSSTSKTSTPTTHLSPSRIQKLIASQSDPLIAKEIFDLASRQPTFRYTYNPLSTLITPLSTLSSSSSAAPAIYLSWNPSSLSSNPTITQSRRPFSPESSVSTVILVFFRENRALDACKVLEDMPTNGCLPNLVSYRTLVSGLCNQGLYDEAKDYMQEMISKGFSPHFLVLHVLIKGLCNVGKTEDACALLVEMLGFGEAPYIDTWVEVVTRICEVEDEIVRMEDILKEVFKVDIKPHTRIIEAGVGLEE